MAELDDDEKDLLLQLMIRQWRALILLEKNRGDGQALDELRMVRELFRAGRRWEDVRTCHLYDAIYSGRDDLLVHLYFGTLYLPFRKRVARELGGRVKIPDDYSWHFTGSAAVRGEKSVLLDLVNGTNSQTGNTLKDGAAVNRLLQALCVDFYKPLQLAAIHEALYLGDYFNPKSSSDRVHQCVKRLRGWFRENRLPLLVQEDMGFYRLESRRPCTVRIGKSGEAGSLARSASELWLRGAIARVVRKYGQQEFSAKEVAQILEMDERSARRYLASAIDLGLVERIVRGSIHRYRKI